MPYAKLPTLDEMRNIILDNPEANRKIREKQGSLLNAIKGFIEEAIEKRIAPSIVADILSYGGLVSGSVDGEYFGDNPTTMGGSLRGKFLEYGLFNSPENHSPFPDILFDTSKLGRDIQKNLSSYAPLLRTGVELKTLDAKATYLYVGRTSLPTGVYKTEADMEEAKNTLVRFKLLEKINYLLLISLSMQQGTYSTRGVLYLEAADLYAEIAEEVLDMFFENGTISITVTEGVNDSKVPTTYFSISIDFGEKIRGVMNLAKALIPLYREHTTIWTNVTQLKGLLANIQNIPSVKATGASVQTRHHP